MEDRLAGHPPALSPGVGGFPQRCYVCHRPSDLEYRVQDEVWASVVPLPYRNRVVCLSCLDGFAHMRGMQYAHAVDHELHFVGNAGLLTLHLQGYVSPSSIL